MLKPLTFPQVATTLPNLFGAGFYTPTALWFGYGSSGPNMGVSDRGDGSLAKSQDPKNFSFLYRKIISTETTHPLIATARRRFSAAGIKMTDIGITDGTSFLRDRSFVQIMGAVASVDASARFEMLKGHMLLTGDECDGKSAELSALLMANYDMRDYPALGNYRFYIGQDRPVGVSFRNTKIGQTSDFHMSSLKASAEAELEAAMECIERDLPVAKEERGSLLRHIMGSLIHYETRFESEDIRLERAWRTIKDSLTA